MRLRLRRGLNDPPLRAEAPAGEAHIVAKEAVNRWTENLETLHDYLKGQMAGAEDQVKQLFSQVRGRSCVGPGDRRACSHLARAARRAQPGLPGLSRPQGRGGQGCRVPQAGGVLQVGTAVWLMGTLTAREREFAFAGWTWSRGVSGPTCCKSLPGLSTCWALLCSQASRPGHPRQSKGLAIG